MSGNQYYIVNYKLINFIFNELYIHIFLRLKPK